MHCVFGAILELAQLVLYGLIGCFVSSSAFLVDSGVVILKCGMGVDLCRYAKVLCILPVRVGDGMMLVLGMFMVAVVLEDLY